MSDVTNYVISNHVFFRLLVVAAFQQHLFDALFIPMNVFSANIRRPEDTLDELRTLQHTSR